MPMGPWNVNSCTDAPLRTRTFLGMVVLVIMLMVASTPALLDPTAERLQSAAAQAGVPNISAPGEAARAEAKARAKAKKQAEQEGTAIEAALALRGRTVEADGSLRDQYDPNARTTGSRLAIGSHRTVLADGAAPVKTPPPLEDGVLLDRTGCPQFSSDQDVATLWADPVSRARYEAKVASADDPAGCSTLFTQRRDEATGADVRTMLPGDARDAASLRRGRTADVGFLLTYQRMLETMLPDAASAAAALTTPAAAGTTAAS